MKNPWDAEHAPEPALARDLARALCPEIGSLPFERVGSGWDVDVWRAGDLAFRFPRRRLGAQTIENELRVLPSLAGRVPLEIPVPYAVGRPTPRFPHVYWAHVFVAGVPVDRARLSESERAELAVPLGRTLAALHGISASEARSFGAPPDELRRDLARVGRRALDRLELATRSGWAPRLPELRAFLERAPSAALTERLIHGDVYSRHLVVDGKRRLRGLIDWGDVCLGDPAVDLAAAFSVLPPPARDAFWSSYGPVDDSTRERARFFAVARHGVPVLAYALDLADAELEREASQALAFALG